MTTSADRLYTDYLDNRGWLDLGSKSRGGLNTFLLCPHTNHHSSRQHNFRKILIQFLIDFHGGEILQALAAFAASKVEDDELVVGLQEINRAMKMYFNKDGENKTGEAIQIFSDNATIPLKAITRLQSQSERWCFDMENIPNEWKDGRSVAFRQVLTRPFSDNPTKEHYHFEIGYYVGRGELENDLDGWCFEADVITAHDCDACLPIAPPKMEG